MFADLKTEIMSLKQQVKLLKENVKGPATNTFHLLPKFPMLSKDDLLQFDKELGQQEEMREQLVRTIIYIFKNILQSLIIFSESVSYENSNRKYFIFYKTKLEENYD